MYIAEARSTVNHLARLKCKCNVKLETEKKHFKLKCNVKLERRFLMGSILFQFFQRRKSLTWRGGVLFDLHKMGMRGLLPKYLTKDDKIRVIFPSTA